MGAQPLRHCIKSKNWRGIARASAVTLLTCTAKTLGKAQITSPPRICEVPDDFRAHRTETLQVGSCWMNDSICDRVARRNALCDCDPEIRRAMAWSMRTLLFVLGMGRSGSSALTRILSACGGTLPHLLFPGNSSNPQGHWEPRKVLEINQRFLLAHRSSWFDCTMRLQSSRDVNREADESFVLAATRYLEEERVPRDACLLIKEPRVSALLPYWLEASRRADFRSKVLLIYRRPEEVARSLAVRDGLSEIHSYLLWLKYNVLGEAGSRRLPRAAFSFNSLLDSPRATLTKAFGRADLPLSVPADAAMRELVVPHLRHHQVGQTQLADPTMTDLVAQVWDLLEAWENGGGDESAWNGVYAAFAEMSGAGSGLLAKGPRKQVIGHFLARLLRREYPRGWTPVTSAIDDAYLTSQL